ncbi:MAG TPA: tetratricopeptide repeat protein [Pyrinomonadaceae bacterium]|nr:tetratricopeptide repeat protein [Pyrinomonadaceae bacterium]
MFSISNSLRALIAVLLAVAVAAAQSTTSILDLIYRQKYDDAITRLEEVLEKDPKNAEALTYMATANLYLHQNFTTALEDFKAAFNAGGGATFFVTHSHEKFNTDYVADYCRGWLHLRKDGIEFVPSEGTHGFKINYGEVEEFKVNRLSKRAFHIKFNQKSQNFYTRSNTEFEPLLIIALHKSFTRN